MVGSFLPIFRRIDAKCNINADQTSIEGDATLSIMRHVAAFMEPPLKHLSLVITLVASAALAGCTQSFLASVPDQPLTPSGARVKLSKNEPDARCRELGDVSGESRKFSEG